MNLHLKVGELAAQTGLTVRTLHHYDQIGLLQPSARSDSGYRLYGRQDVARLHAIQALRHLGLELKDIRAVLGGEGPGIGSVLDKQIDALASEIARARELRERLLLLRAKLERGAEPDMADWLGALSQMSSYGKYFSAAELKKILEKWPQVKSSWPPLLDAVRAAMARGLTPDSAPLQPLVHRWMSLMARWMDGDMDLMARWGEMYRADPAARTAESPEPAMLRFMTEAIDLRMRMLTRYFDNAQLMRLSSADDAAWRALAQDVKTLKRDGAPIGGAEWRALVRRWRALLTALTQGDAAMSEALESIARDEPLWRPTALLSTAATAMLKRAEREAGKTRSAVRR